MAWSDIGFNENLSVTEVDNINQQLDPLQSDYITQEVSGTKIQGGIIQSRSGKLVLDLEKDLFKLTDGVIDRVQMGILADGTVGFIIQDKNGNKLLQFSESNNIIQSSSGAFVIDVGNEQFLLIVNEIPQFLLGKQIGGF